MTHLIRDIELEAFSAQKRGDYLLAADRWRRIVDEHDNWEHGYAHYYLADCLARLGRFDEAVAEYHSAIRIEPNDALFREALSSLQDAKRNGRI